VEKRTAHYDLAAVQADVGRLGVAGFTRTAPDGGRAIGLTSGEMLTVVASLTRRGFYKSMTSHSDHTVWHDVYYAPTPVGRIAYIKIKFRASAPVIQFKEK
jgi:motility quorum-sensing regulator/GCU-specific mRNA interferase toxin